MKNPDQKSGKIREKSKNPEKKLEKYMKNHENSKNLEKHVKNLEKCVKNHEKSKNPEKSFKNLDKY